MDKFSYAVNQNKKNSIKAIAKQFSGLRVNEDIVKKVIIELSLDNILLKWNNQQLKSFTQRLRKITKPIIIAANKIDIRGAQDNLKRIKKEFNDYIIIGCSAESELALKEAAKHGLIEYVPGDDNYKIVGEEQLNDKQKHALKFINSHILKNYGSTGVQEVMNNSVLKLLNYISVFPVPSSKLKDANGKILPDCFLVEKGTTVIDFAFKIHTDIGKNFIRAINVKSNMALKKDQVLKNRDVVEIIHHK